MNMEIPSDHWKEFVDDFSKTHVGWPVTIKTLDPELGDQSLATDLPLLGISFDIGGTRPASMEISAGHPQGHVAHSVDLPLHIRLMETDPDGPGALEIEPAKGPRTLMEFHPPQQLPA